MSFSFRDTCRLAQLPYLSMKLGHWPKCQKFHIYPLSTPKGSKLSLFLLYGQRFPRYRPIFKIAIFGLETWQVAKVPEVAHIPSFYPRGSKFSLFLLYGQRFLKYGPIFKIAIFGHETLQVVKVPEVAHILSFYCSVSATFQVCLPLKASLSSAQ